MYISKLLADAILALSKGRTSINYGCGHTCEPHQRKIDTQHIMECNLLEKNLEVTPILRRLKLENLRTCDDFSIAEAVLVLSKIKMKVVMLESLGLYREYTWEMAS